jgi:lipopolysaccharide biosynthesis regulator YciM
LSELGEHIEALRRDPTSDDAAQKVREKGRQEGALLECAQAFAERAGSLLSRGMEKESIASLVEAALIYEEDLEDLGAAADLYRRILEIESDHRRALFALGLLLHDLAEWDELIQLYRRRLESSQDDGERTTFHLYIAELLAERKDDPQAAFNEVTTAARLAPRNIRIISRLEKLGETTGRMKEVAVVIGDLILHQDDPRVRAALSLRLAELHLGPLDDSQRALAYLRAALEDDGGNPEILHEVEDVFRERARFDELAEILEHAAKDRRVGPHRVRLERELARIYELELGDKKRALVAMTRAVKNAPDDRELLDEILRLGLMTQEMALVAETFEDVLGRTDNALLRTYMRLKLGHLYATTLGRLEDAVRVYAAILDEDASHKEAFRRLLALHEKRNDVQGIALLWRKEALRRDAVDDVGGAVEAWRRLLAVLPDDREAREALAKVDLASRVGSSAVETHADEMPTEIAGEEIDSEAETVFDREPVKGPPPPPPFDPFSDLSDPSLRVFLGTGADLLAPDPVERVSAPAPDPSVRAGGSLANDLVLEVIQAGPVPPPAPVTEWETQSSQQRRLATEIEERIVLLQQELQDATKQSDKTKCAEVLQAIVRAYEQVNNLDRAFFSMVRLAQIDPTPERMEETIRLGRKAQGYPVMIETVQSLAAGMGLEVQVRVGVILAEVELEDLHDVTASVKRLSALAALAPDDPLVFERWMNVLERTRRFADLVMALRDRAMGLAGSSEAASMIRRAAQLRESELSDPRGAAEILTAYLERSPERDDLRQEAATLLTKSECWIELVRLLESGLHRLEGEERSDTRLRIARLYIDRLGDLAAAERTLRLGLEERARDPALLALLEEIYEGAQDWEALVDVLMRRLDVVKGARGRNAIRRRIAEVAEKSLGKEELALDILSDAVRDDPGDVEALAEIERLRRGRGDWDGVIEVLSMKARALTDPEPRALALVGIAQITADAHGDLDSAATSLREALSIVPDVREALDALAAIEERRGDYDAAINALRTLTTRVQGAEKARVYVRLGRIYERHLEDTEGATTEYQDAYDADPNCLDAILALLRIRELEEDFARAMELAARAAELTDDERDRADLFRRAGHLAQDRVGDELRAIEYYDKALLADPDDLATCALIGQLYFSRQDLEKAYAPLFKAASGLSDPARTATLYAEAGQAAEKLNQRARAIECYDEALLRSPKAFEPLRRLSALLEQTEEWPRVYELSAALILHHESAFVPLERSVIYLRMARAKHAAREFAAAARLAKKAHQLAETLVEPLALLADALADGGEPFDAAEYLKRLSQLQRSPRDKRDTLLRAAVLLAEKADDPSRGAAMLAEAQAFVPEDLEVAELLAGYREQVGDASGAASALAVPARLLLGRARSDLLVRAARIAGGSGRDRDLVKKLLAEALEPSPTHDRALPDLALLLEFDGEVEELILVLQRAADTFLNDATSARDAKDLDRTQAAVGLFDEVLRLSRYRLDDPERALRAARKLMELAPDVARYREELALLLDRARERRNGDVVLVRESIGAWARLVEDRPGYIEGLHKLHALSIQGADHDQARLAHELLFALGDPQALQIPPNGESVDSRPPAIRERIDVPNHPDEKSPLEGLFNDLGYGPIRAFFELLPEPKPKKRDLVGAAGLGIHVTRPLELAAAVLGVPVPPVFVRDDALTAVQPALVLDEPGLIVSLVLAAKHSPGELRFLIGRALSLLRPRALTLVTVPLDVLRDAMAGLAKPAIAPEVVFADPKQAKKRGKALERVLAAHDRGSVAERIGSYLQNADRRTLADERAAVLRTAERAGLVVSGSLLASIEAMKQLSDGRVDRAWHLPLIEFAATRRYAEIVRRVHSGAPARERVEPSAMGG